MRLMHNIKILFIASFILIGCEQSHLVNDNVREAEKEAQSAIETISPDTAKRTPLKIDNRPWYGTETIPMKSGKSLPRQLTTANALTLTFAGPASFQESTRMVESITSIPVRLSNNIYETSLGDIANKQFLPTGGQEVSGGRTVWSGSLQNLLNQISSFYSSEWSYDQGVITFSSEQTKTFMLNALANEIELTENSSSTGGGGEDSNAPEIEIDGTTTLEIWGEISQTVENIIGTAGNVTFSPSTGAITVTARQDVLRRVENYLRYQNQMRLRRIAISVKVLSIETSDTTNYNLDISGAITTALGGGFRIAGSQTDDNGLSLDILKTPVGNTSRDIASTLEAKEGIQRVNIVHSGSLVTLSDQPAPLQVSRQIAYLERVSSSGGDTASVSLEPGTIDVGLFMTVLPRIVEDDRILMRLSIAITDADRNFRTFGTDELKIELPEIDTTGFLQNAVVGNGETMVLAGFEKTTNSLSSSTNPFGFIFGGNESTTRGREMLVLLINSRILPEQPLTIIGQ